MAVFVVSAPPAHAAVIEKVTRKPYHVSGATEAAVRTDINARRPGRYDAQTQWRVSWRYWYRPTEGACAISRVTVTLDITFIMPRLVSEHTALQKSFDDYMEKLMRHEDGHADIAREIARRIEPAIAGLTAETCEALGRKASAAGHDLVKEGSALQVKYDAQTDHGATQGARWPRRAGAKPSASAPAN